MSVDPDCLIFNGINGASGKYLLPPMTPRAISQIARGEPQDSAHLDELRWRCQQATEAHLGVVEGVDPTNLAEAGWGVIFAHDVDPEIREALGGLLASGSVGSTVTLWDVASGRRIGELLRGPPATVWTVAFSPDGKSLTSGSEDQTIILWDVSSLSVATGAEWQDRVYRIAHRNLSSVEWQQFVGAAEQYARICPGLP